MPYIGAPYNFVPFADQVYNPVPKEHMEDHDKIYKVEKVSADTNGEERYSGEISYTITAESPIIIDDGNGHFFKNENGNFAIPGSTMRGLIRGNAQILGASGVRRDIDDYRLMYRHVANGALKGEYGIRLGNSTVTYHIAAQNRNASISILKNVLAGYIRCNDDGKYEISPTVIGSVAPKMPNYYVLSERKIVYEWEKYVAGPAGATFAYDLFVTENKSGKHPVCSETILMHLPDHPFKMSIRPRRGGRTAGAIVSNRPIWYDPSAGGGGVYTLSDNAKPRYQAGELVTWKKGDRMITELKDVATRNSLCTGDIHYTGTDNPNYAPYALPCSYKVSPTEPKDIDAVSAPGKPSSSGWKQGWAVSTGRMKEKKAVYIIPAMASTGSFELDTDSQVIKSFRIDYNKRENALKSLFNAVAVGNNATEKNEDKKRRTRECFGLPQKGSDPKPVFYISFGNASSTYISFTPHLRLFFDHTVAEGIHQATVNPDKYDLAASLFGFSEEDGNLHFKSKVSFADAELTPPADQKNSLEGQQQTVILAEPKPSSYLDYLEQSDQLSTYSSKSFKLRGIKQYWLRNAIYHGNTNNNNENVGSRFTPLKESASFTGKIRFQNLTGEELGLLLWSIRLEPGCKMNVGKGKPYGFGVISISDLKTRILNTEQAYNTDELILDPLLDLSEAEQNALIDKYQKTVVGGKKILETASVKAFLRMKSEIPDPDRIKYMSIDNKDYQNRKSRLHTVDETLDEKPGFEPPEVEAPQPSNGGNLGGAMQTPELKPIRKESYIKVIIGSLIPDEKNRGKQYATFTEWYRTEPGHENDKHEVKEGGVYKVSGDKKVGDKIRIRVTKIETEEGTEKLIKGEQY